MQYIASRAGVLYMYESSPLPSLSLPLKSATISCSKDCKVEVRRGREEVLTLLPPPNSALSLSRILSLLCKARDWEDEVVAVVPCTLFLCISCFLVVHIDRRLFKTVFMPGSRIGNVDIAGRRPFHKLNTILLKINGLRRC